MPAPSKALLKATSETPLEPAGIAQRFDQNATAIGVVEGVSLNGKVVLITGATSGIGVETARAMAKTGAHVIITGRDLEKAKPIVADIIATTGNSKVEAMFLRLDGLKYVRQFCTEFLARKLPLNIIICNAGVMAFPTLTKTEDGFEMQFGTNHLAHFLMVNQLLPAFKQGGKGGRLVVLTSIGHKRSPMLFDNYNFDKPGSYDKWVAYGQSKCANVLFAKEFNRLFSPCGITANAVHPGGILTGLQVNMPVEEQKAMGWFDKDGKLNPVFKNTQEGAATSVWAAVAPELEGIGGYYFEDTWFGPMTPATEQVYYGTVPHAHDMEVAKKLWELSVKLTGLDQACCQKQTACCGGDKQACM